MKPGESFYTTRKLVDLVENQTSFELKDSALHIFETHAKAERVELQFGTPVLASMFQGKKVMHLRGKEAFDFLPGESLILPANEIMCIDFPEARMDNPTQCLAMEIGEERILRVIEVMNEQMSRADDNEWGLMDYNFHFTNDPGIYKILQRLVYLYTENHPSKEFFVSNMVNELIVRILQTNARKTYGQGAAALKSGQRFAFLVHYIRQNLDQDLTIDDLSEKACMSKSNFYKVFRNEFGISPIDFINQERIAKAVEMLKQPETNLTEIFLACGFRNRSYFNRMFKRIKGISPVGYQKRFHSEF
ncbi:MAG: AraC family transcriptional regulator [Bacteroidota bacterium]